MIYHTVLIAFDFSDPASLQPMLETAVRLTEGDARGVVVICADESDIHQAGITQANHPAAGERRRRIEADMQALLASLPESLPRPVCVALPGVTHDVILSEARKRKADGIIMMARRPGLASYLLGSNAERVLRHSTCSVFVLRRASMR